MAKTETKTAAFTTQEEVLQAHAEKRISLADASALLKSLSPKPRAVARTIKLNSSGGLYVTDPSFKAWSTKKSKYYIAGVNLPIDVARALFAGEQSDSIIADIRQFLKETK